MGCKGKNRLDSSPCRVIHKGCEHDRAIASFEEGVTEGPLVRTSDADVFYQPSRKGSQRFATRGTRACEEIAIETSAEPEELSAERSCFTEPGVGRAL
jgi:hypothetical protein